MYHELRQLNEVKVQSGMLIARRILVYLGAEHLINTETTLRKIWEVYNDQLYTFRDRTILI